VPLLFDRNQISAWLDDLVPLGGISGHESGVMDYMAGELTAHADHVRCDELGNLIARFGSEDAARQIAVLAHMDTVGFMIKTVGDDGICRVVPVGGVNLKALPGAAVTVWRYSDHAPLPQLPGIPGVIGVRSQHVAQPGDTATNIDDLYIQIDPAACDQISVTAPVTFAPRIVRLSDHLVSSPYLDNRAGCAVLLALGAWLGGAKKLFAETTSVHLIGTVQEETTCLGALHALRRIAPRTAIFVDGTLSYDTPETSGRGSVRLGSGPVLTSFLYASGLNGWHADPGLRSHLKDHAVTHGVPFQEDAIRGLISDARAATWLGIPSALIGLPMRSKHAPLEIVHLDDLTRAAQLIALELGDPYDLP
jgi:putative aminopeptidase FrvX